MGTISQKIEYLNETKQRQKTLINALGGNITNDTPFREYEQELVGVLPKVTGEGTNISLSPTIEYDLEVGSYKGDTTQNTLQGYNIAEVNTSKYTLTDDNAIQITGGGNVGALLFNGVNLTANTTYYLKLIVLQKPSTATTFSAYVDGINDASLDFTGINNATIGTVYSKTYTPSSNCIFTVKQWGNSNSEVVKFQYWITTDNSKNTYEPYCGAIPSPNPNYPQDIQVVTGTQEIKVTGSNRLNNSKVVKGRLDNGVIGYESGTTSLDYTIDTISFTTNANYRGIVSDYIEIKESTYFLFSFESISNTSSSSYTASFYDENKNYLSNVTGYGVTNGYRWANNVTNAKYFRIAISLYTAGSQTFTKPQIKFVNDLNIPSYSPYTSQTYTLHLGDLELAKIGTYQDYIYYDNGKWYKTNGIQTLDKNHVVNSINSTAEITDYVRIQIRLNGDTISSPNGLCNYFTMLASWSGQSNHFYCQSTLCYLFIAKSLLTSYDVAGVKTYINTLNDFEIKYILATASTTEITNETLLSDLEYIRTHSMSYSGTTNISISGNLPVIISASALKGE